MRSPPSGCTTYLRLRASDKNRWDQIGMKSPGLLPRMLQNQARPELDERTTPPRRGCSSARKSSRNSAKEQPRGRRMLKVVRCDTRSDRKSVVEGKSVSGRVDLGGRRIIKKKK